MSVKFIQSLSQRSSVSTSQLKPLGRDSTRGLDRRRPQGHSGRNFWKPESFRSFGEAQWQLTNHPQLAYISLSIQLTLGLTWVPELIRRSFSFL